LEHAISLRKVVFVVAVTVGADEFDVGHGSRHRAQLRFESLDEMSEAETENYCRVDDARDHVKSHDESSDYAARIKVSITSAGHDAYAEVHEMEDHSRLGQLVDTFDIGNVI
jgi:hypothetical protein